MKKLISNFTPIIFLLIMVFTGSVLSKNFDEKRLTFMVSKGGKLDVHLNFGNITIYTWDKNEASLSYKTNVRGEKEPLKISQSGNEISVRSKDDWTASDLTAYIPNRFDITLRTSAGNVQIKQQLTGKVTISTEAGNIFIEKAEGPATIRTDGGDINVKQLNGKLDAYTDGGNLKIGTVEGEAALRTSGGNISIAKVTSKANINSSGGNISAAELGSASDIRTGGGNIEIENAGGDTKISTGGGNIGLKSCSGSVTARSGSGNIELLKVQGSVNASTHGGDLKVGMTLEKGNESRIRTNAGNITIHLSERGNAKITARVRGYGIWSISDAIVSDFKAESIEQSKYRGDVTAVYTLNKGDKEITLEAASGKIGIYKLKSK